MADSNKHPQRDKDAITVVPFTLPGEVMVGARRPPPLGPSGADVLPSRA